MNRVAFFSRAPMAGKLGKLIKQLLEQVRKPIKIPAWFYWLIGSILLVALLFWLVYWGIQVWLDWATLQQNATDATKKKFDGSLDIAKAIVGGIGTVATIAGGVVLYLNFRIANKNTTLTESRLITERFSKAVEQLGSNQIEVRLGGIYALERIAYDSDRDHWTIMEVLTSFIRKKNSTRQKEEDKLKQLITEPIEEDIQAALTVISRRNEKNDPPGKELDLNSVYLTYANLSGAKLIGANLRGAKLSGANLSGAKLIGANLIVADLSGAILEKAELNHAKLNDADLGSANLGGAILQSAELIGADLWVAKLIGAELIGAKLNGAKLNGAKLEKAKLNDANLSDADLRHANFSGANLSGAKLTSADLSDAILASANLRSADLFGANLTSANLSGANLSGANLTSADLSGAALNGAILLATDLRETENLMPDQLEGVNPTPLLCNVALPNGFSGNDQFKYRDCAEMPQELCKRYPNDFKRIEDAEKMVVDERQKLIPDELTRRLMS